MALVARSYSLLDFPDELLLYIFKYIPSLDFFRTLPLVCTHFHRLARDRIVIRQRLRRLGYILPALNPNKKITLAAFSTERCYYVRYGRCLDLVQAFLSFEWKLYGTAYKKLEQSETRKRRYYQAEFLKSSVGRLLHSVLLNHYGLSCKIPRADRIFLDILYHAHLVDSLHDKAFCEQISAASFTVKSRASLARLFGHIFPLNGDWLRDKVQTLLPHKKTKGRKAASKFIVRMTMHCFKRVCDVLTPKTAPPFFPRLSATRAGACDSMAACVTRLTALLRVEHQQTVHLSGAFMRYLDPNIYEEWCSNGIYRKNGKARRQSAHPEQSPILFHRNLLTHRQDLVTVHDSGLDIPFTITNMTATFKLPHAIPIAKLLLIGCQYARTPGVFIRVSLNENDAGTVVVHENGRCVVMGTASLEQVRVAISELMMKLAPLMKPTV